jgi:hypothetical protein
MLPGVIRIDFIAGDGFGSTGGETEGTDIGLEGMGWDI